MPDCENCAANVLPDAVFCDACGHKIGTPSGAPASASGEAKPGSLRSEVAFLAGAVDQAKVRLENWRQKGDQAKVQADRSAEIARQDKQQERKKTSPLQAVIQFLVGLAALAAFVFLLIRMPRNSNPTMILQLWKQFQIEFFDGTED